MKNSIYDTLIFENQEIRFQKIAVFELINLHFGITDSAWILIDQGTIYILPYSENNFIGFYKILELNFEDFLNSFLVDQKEIIRYFPLDKITMSVFQSESNYWLGLCLNLLKALDYGQESIVYNNQNRNTTWISQENIHKIKSLAKKPSH
ncbi:hypothetical protein HUK80_17580 [Flavobacterium sp. MAH-1]|uniref:Uncharacterized protein n=1 Tax=Flavobacterium agri TaxID=2743471 RepID=A0A7Y8Y5C6_9FLAO|nr:hypothetical protein [Flavobacterium agri]NUY82718.1 hypothetical protein [Flavobacterium agri]NYA72741.1 hypothetical protein [Flavobacterium agri]